MAANPGVSQALARSGADIFPFLNLPAELRNNIYQLALQHDSHSMIHGVTATRSPRGRGRGRSKKRRPESGDRMLQMPFLGLSQTCKAIRDEFRPLYIGDQAVPISAIALYMYAFMEQPGERWKATFNVFHKTVGRLQITIDEAVETNVLPLLRLKALHGTCKVEVRSYQPGHDPRVAPLVHLINNQNKTWLHLVKDGQINATRLTSWYLESKDNIRLRIVLRTLAKATWDLMEESYLIDWDARDVDRRKIGLECPGLFINFSCSD